MFQYFVPFKTQLGLRSRLLKRFRIPTHTGIWTISGLYNTAFVIAVYASQAGPPQHHARLASGCWPNFSQAGLITRRVTMKGFRYLHFILLPQALPGATQSRTSCE